MEKFTDEELRLLIFLVRSRLNYEARRGRRPDQRVLARSKKTNEGYDVQNLRTWTLSELLEKLEGVRLAR